jgi:DNA repair protein RecN (Recombination protein N)
MGYNPRMLRSLAIRNHSLIATLDLELEGGFCVITGETGAGKSIVLDALGLAIGNRADARALREGAERLEVSAEFDVSATPAAQAWLAERSLEQEDACVLRRVMTRDGRSRAWVNGQAATLADLKSLGDMLVDMHAQHEHHALLSRATQQQVLDDVGGQAPRARAVATAYAAWRDCRDELAALEAGAREREDRRELLRYQLQELQELGLSEGETEALESRQRLLANAGVLRKASTMTAALQPLGARAEGLRDLISSAAIQVEEARRELLHLGDTIESDPAALAAVEARLSLIYQLARKHRVTPAELPALQQRLQDEERGIAGSDARIGQLAGQLDALRAAWATEAKALGTARRRAAAEVSVRVGEQLAFLGMGACRFDIAVTPVSGKDPSPHGTEQIEFMVATNPGATPGPLARIASGGELSRISLAIQVITASRSTTPTVIFDEVDVGIGGATADAVGSLLQELGRHAQVLCVTHLAQVAARGIHHLRAAKTVTDGVTSASLEALSGNERVEEIARMIGGRNLTAKTRAHAKEMLQTAAG